MIIAELGKKNQNLGPVLANQAAQSSLLRMSTSGSPVTLK